MQTAEYWEKRFIGLTDALMSMSETFYKKELERAFKQATIEMEKDLAYWYSQFADNNGLTSMTEAKKLLQGDSLQEFRWTLDDYIKAGESSNLDPRFIQQMKNASAKHHIQKIQALQLAMQNHIESLYGKTDKALQAHLTDVYEKGFLHTAYEIDKGTGLHTKFRLDTDLVGVDMNKLQAILSKPWVDDGKTFSDRLWTNKTELNHVLKEELSKAVIRGDDLPNAVKAVRDRMNVATSSAARLVMTESAYFASKSQHDCFSGLGVEKFEFVATLDRRTSEQCREHDGKVYDMKDYKVGVNAPPLHCWCRSTTVPWFDDEEAMSGERAARDPKTGKTVHVPADMTYRDWEEVFVKGTKSLDGWRADKVAGKLIVEDITKDYPYRGKGNITFDAGYKKNDHQEEIKVAQWIKDNIGGNIRLLEEARQANVKTPDYLWNGEQWELKTVTSVKAVDGAVRGGIKQIQGNIGGLILDCNMEAVDIQALEDAITKRIRRVSAGEYDIMILSQGKLLFVKRYKK